MRGENPIRPVVAANIKAAREAASLSRAELAEKVGCTTQAIYTYENEKADPSYPMLFEIAKAVGLGKNWLWLYQSHEDQEVVTLPRDKYNQLVEELKQARALQNALSRFQKAAGDDHEFIVLKHQLATTLKMVDADVDRLTQEVHLAATRVPPRRKRQPCYPKAVNA